MSRKMLLLPEEQREISERLKRLCESGIQEEIAAAIGVAQQTISKYKAGKTPGIDVAFSLWRKGFIDLPAILSRSARANVEPVGSSFEAWARSLGVDPEGEHAGMLRSQWRAIRESQTALEFAAAEVRRQQHAPRRREAEERPPPDQTGEFVKGA